MKPILTKALGMAILLSVFSGPAGAIESAADFAKCQKMLRKNADWLAEKVAKVELKHDQKMNALIGAPAAGHPDGAREEARLRSIAEKLVEEYELPHYRRALVDNITDEILNVENTDGFRCFNKGWIQDGVKSNLKKYTQVLEEVQEAVEDRLDIENLEPDEGLAVILMYVNGRAEQVDINRLGKFGGGIQFGPVNDSDYFRVKKVKAGKYRWHSIWFWSWGRRMIASLRHSKSDFSVEAGKLNYIGAFIYDAETPMRYTTKMVDRASVVLSILERRYPELLEKYEVNNGLTNDNGFLDYYFDEKRLADEDDDGA